MLGSSTNLLMGYQEYNIMGLTMEMENLIQQSISVICSIIPLMGLHNVGEGRRGAEKNTVWANLPAFHDRLVCQSDDVDTLLDHKHVRIEYARLAMLCHES